MRRICGLVAVLLLLVFITPVYADDKVPDDLTVIVANPVLTANSVDTTTITITVLNLTNPVPNLLVDFIVNDTPLGYLSPSSNTTDGSGIAQTTFTVKDYAGNAGITARVHYGESQFKDFPAGVVEILPLIPDTIEFNTTKEWLVANGSDSCLAVVKAYNGTSPVYPVPHLSVHFSLNESEMLSFDPNQNLTEFYNTTDTSGTSTAPLYAKYKSGDAHLQILITYYVAGIEQVKQYATIQKIDHDTPYQLKSYSVPDVMSVGKTAFLTLVYQDHWENLVDNRRIAENVTFLVSSSLGDAVFLNSSYPFNVTVVPVNAAGEAIAELQASSKPDINTVRVNPDMGSIPDKYFFIQGLANRTPTNISQEFTPAGYLNNPPKLYADGNSAFDIIYTVTDEFGNGVMKTPVLITTSLPNEERIVYTNSIGQAILTYGPKTSIGKITITATAMDGDYPRPTCSKEVWFISQEAEDMQFTAVPDSMPSRDVPNSTPAMLLAKVVDENGNPVENETVTFSLGTPEYDVEHDPADITDPPELVNPTAVTNSNGFAIGYFNPGGFTVWPDPLTDDTASGSCIVTAHWENVSRGKSVSQNLSLSWKNYPYLSIETFVFPQTVNVTGTVNVTVRLKGDGWALHPKPIDAVLCTDRSGSMLQDKPDRMVSVINAAQLFTGAMHVSPPEDHIGLVSFGTLGWANLSPTPIHLNQKTVWCRNNSAPTNKWNYRNLTGDYYDWRNVYGVYQSGSSPPYYYIDNTVGFWWVKNDSYSSMEMANPYDIAYWPYTASYDLNSIHHLYIKDNYPGNNRYYNDYAIYESHLIADPSLINSSIRNMTPTGGTPMRYGLYNAINDIKTANRTKAIRAVVLLSDGDYNWYGDPLARGTNRTSWSVTDYRFGDWQNYPQYLYDYKGLPGLTPQEQNLSIYAKNNNIRIYSIGYAEDISVYGRTALRTLAESTGGQYWDADASNINDVYATIAGLLQEEAGVNTTMDLDYGTIEVNYNLTTINDTYQVFEYIPFTNVDSWINTSPITKPAHDPPYDYPLNQSNDYAVNKSLSFYIGTVKLNQIWQAQYTLRVLTDGSINIFGPNSTVNFNGTEGPSQLWVPKTYITGVPNMTTTGVNTSYLNITVGEPEDTGTSIINFPIYRDYTGNMTVKEDYYISIDGGMTWILMGFNVLTPEQANRDSIYSIDRNYYPPGVAILFKVVGNALDAPGPIITTSRPAPPPPPPAKSYIFLK